MLNRVRETVAAVFNSPNMPSRRPVLDDRFQSNVPGIYVVGELAGAPVVKIAMEHGYTVARRIITDLGGPRAVAVPAGAGAGAAYAAVSQATEVPTRSSTATSVLAPNEDYDVIVIGAGAAGLNAALELQDAGFRVLVLEKGRVASTIDELPEGKWIYTAPDERAAVGKLWLEECTKEHLSQRWMSDILAAGLNVHTGEAVTGIDKSFGGFVVKTPKAEYSGKRVILAIGKSGTPRKLGVPGEDSAGVHHKLYSPKPYAGTRVLVVGGGNSAVEAAVALAKSSDVTLSYRGDDLFRVSKQNRKLLEDAVIAGRVRLLLSSRVSAFDSGTAILDIQGRSERVAFDHAFVLIGSEPPTAFLRSLGLRLENDWTPKRISALIFSFLLCYSIYGIKQGPGHEFWPYTGWAAKMLAFGGRSWGFWYTVLYTAAMTIFGISAMKRWGFDRKDKFQIWRYVSLIGFQWIFFFLIPEFLFRVAVQYQWVGAKLASDPSFANNGWRAYGIIYAWPLFFYTFFSNPNQVWIVWGAVLSFILIPILVLFHGKRYCSWICGCGGLAETFGDRWRHLAPKGPASIKAERMNTVVLIAAVAVTAMVLGRDLYSFFSHSADRSLEIYHFVVDTWLVSIIPVALYPFMGGKVWCRYWCPLAKLMEVFSAVFTRFQVSRFAIKSNDKCIACEDCTRNCQVGIDVMRFALKQEEITNWNSSCIGCGICVTVCPMDVLSFGKPSPKPVLVQIKGAA